MSSEKSNVSPPNYTDAWKSVIHDLLGKWFIALFLEEY